VQQPEENAQIQGIRSGIGDVNRVPAAPVETNPPGREIEPGLATPGDLPYNKVNLPSDSPAREFVVLRIVTYPHPALRYESRPVTRIDDTLRDRVREMFALMYEAKGIGLAANQVAIPYRFFVLNLTADPEQKDQEHVFINPEIVKRHSSIEDEEGCLSFPGLYSKVRRARKIKVRAFDLDGNPIEIDAEELKSRAIQHETDHLSGRLFIDHLEPLARKNAEAKVREFETQFRQAQAAGEFPSDDEIIRQLDAL
jgi:peptide deformylase